MCVYFNSFNAILMWVLLLLPCLPVAPQRERFGETERGARGAESQDGGPGQRVCPPQPDQRETGGRFGCVPRQTPHLAPGGPSPSLSVSVCMR